MEVPSSLPEFQAMRRWTRQGARKFLYDMPHIDITATGGCCMSDEQKRAEEAQAMERVVNCTRQVQVAFTALQSQYPPQGGGKPSKIALQTFDAALQALEDAQAAFDEVLNDLLDGNR
jgi:hypothetical protein